ncbi:MAG: hypothetical protein KJN62_01000, partial [Deltaproteobacteria bacterium]|nr:hypothetical protein [Deltaproteobacteria bacterium]
MNRISKALTIVMALALVVLMSWVNDTQARTLKIGAAINLTGPASTWGRFHAKGLQDYVTYVNDVKGGIQG